MMLEQQAVLARATQKNPSFADAPSAEAMQQAMASLEAHQPPTPPAPTGELKYKLTMLIFPAILLLFVALYVTCLASGIDPEVGLFRSGGASLVLAVLARIAVGILGDDTRLVLNDHQIMAMARSEAVREYLANADGEHGPDPAAAGTQQPIPTAEAAVTGGKE